MAGTTLCSQGSPRFSPTPPRPAGGLAVRPWFAVPTSWDPVPAERRPASSDPLRAVHPHQLRRWQDRYAVAAAHAPSTRLALERLLTAL